jgi:excisionase family DNA binding protein
MANEKYLTVKETSEFLKMSRSTLNRLIKQNRIPSHKIGDRRLFNKNELVEWVRNRPSDGKGSSESRLVESLLRLLNHLEYCP